MKWSEWYHRSYVPYSAQPVGVVVQGKNGKFYPGSRIENISFPLTISAIQAACCICMADGSVPEVFYVEEGNEPEQLDFWKNEFNATVKYGEQSPLSELPDYRSDDHSDSLLSHLLESAVVIHSDFPVSCIIESESDRISGVNIEVSEWTKGLCAERLALSKAIISGIDLKKAVMHICTQKGQVSAPCGACRQVIMEHMPFNSLELTHADGTHSSHLSVDLLPFNFKTTALNKDSE